MTPAEFVTEIVVPTVRELRDEPQSRRRAYLACIMTYHVTDYLKRASARDIDEILRAALPGGEFDVVKGVCNGTKHVKTGRSHLIAFQAGDDVERAPAQWGVASWDEANWDDETGGRDIKHQGRVVDIYTSVRRVLLALKRSFPAHLGRCDLSDC